MPTLSALVERITACARLGSLRAKAKRQPDKTGRSSACVHAAGRRRMCVFGFHAQVKRQMARSSRPCQHPHGGEAAARQFADLARRHRCEGERPGRRAARTSTAAAAAPPGELMQPAVAQPPAPFHFIGVRDAKSALVAAQRLRAPVGSKLLEALVVQAGELGARLQSAHVASRQSVRRPGSQKHRWRAPHDSGAAAIGQPRSWAAASALLLRSPCEGRRPHNHNHQCIFVLSLRGSFDRAGKSAYASST